MIICKFTKIDSAVYIPHLDLLREMVRAVRRADLNVKFSEGFNPHMLLYFSQPLPLGLDSIAEYFCADSDEDPEDFKNRLNKKLARGVKITASAKCDKAEVHSITTHASYRYFSSEKPFEQSVFDDIMAKPTLEIPVKTKKGYVLSDVRNRVYSLKAEGSEAVAILGCGKENLRADSFAKFLAERFSLKSDVEMIKTGAYSVVDGKLKSIDEIYGLK